MLQARDSPIHRIRCQRTSSIDKVGEADFTQRLLIFTVVGLVAQFVDGALGMAYGVTATTLLISTGSSAALASASVHLAEVGSTLASGLAHRRFGNVHWRTVRWLALPGAVGGFLGATLLGSLPGDKIRPVVAGLLLCLGFYVMVHFAFGDMSRATSQSHLKRRWLGTLGLGAGFVDAVGGGGWGPITTPTLMTVGRMNPRFAVGSASASEFLVALSASIGFLLTLGRRGIDLGLVTALLVGGVVAAPLAAWLVRRVQSRVMGTLVGTLILFTNLRTLLIAAGVPGPARIAVLSAVAAGSLVSLKIARGHRKRVRRSAPSRT